MQVFLQKDAKFISVEHSGTAKELLMHLGISSDTVLIIRDNVLITEDDSVDGAERVDLLSVVSGG